LNIAQITGNESLEELRDHVARLQKEVQWLVSGNLSSKNAREFGGWRVGTKDLMALDGTVGMSTDNVGTDPVRFWAGSTDKNTAPWRVYKSGKGVATGWRIQSAAGYPNIEIDPDGNLFGVYASASSYIRMRPLIDGGPQITWNNGLENANAYLTPSVFVIQATTDMLLEADSIILVSPIVMPNWSSVLRADTGQTLQAALDGKANSFSGFTGFVAVGDGAGGTKTLLFSNGIFLG
jgi:hypothetical protein